MKIVNLFFFKCHAEYIYKRARKNLFEKYYNKRKDIIKYNLKKNKQSCIFIHYQSYSSSLIFVSVSELL